MSARIVVPDDFPSAITGTPAETLLRTLGDVQIFTERGAENEAELVARLGNARAALNIRAYSKFTARVLDACPTLGLISIWGTGTDNVDLDACAARNITVANTPGVNANAVAEHTIALILAVTRRIPAMDSAVRAGQWPRGLLTQLEGKTLGLLGLGAIGTRVAKLAAPFGMRLLVSTSGPDAGRAAALGATHVPVDELLREADIVSLHMRLTADTKDFLDGRRIALMRPNSFLINTARAGLVDRTAMIDALANGRIAGAGLDVFHQEPLAADDDLLALPNVVLTPHDSGMTAEVLDVGLRRAVQNIQQYLDR